MTDRSATYSGFLCVYDADLHPIAMAVLERFHVTFVRRTNDDDVWYEVPAITAQQYDAVIAALSDCGEPGIDWDFTLD
jgi:hypothetical protein